MATITDKTEHIVSWREKLGKGCMPQRYVLGLMGFLAVVNAYTMRNCLSLAITEMVIYHKHHDVAIDPNACPGEIQIRNHTIDYDNEFDWDEKTQGYILSAFYWGYVLTHIPGGLMAERLGGKHVLGIGILGTSVFTLLTPVAARAGPWWLVFVRFIEGFGEGMTFPALNALLARWVPPLERGKLGSLVFAGNQIGIVMSNVLAGLMLKYNEGSWASVFYFFGSLGVIWYIFWCLLCYNDPGVHPFITQTEKEYLFESIGGIKKRDHLPPTPWLRIFSSWPVWALIIGQIGHDWSLFTIQADLPKYMKSVLKFSVAQNGFLSSLPFMMMWITAMVSGWWSDFLLKREVYNVSTVRKLFTSIASFGPGLGVLAASYAGCNRILVMVLFTVGMSLMGFFYPSLKVNALDLSPNYAGTMMALVNGIGAISGIITPTLVGFLIPNSTLLEWRRVFWLAGVVIVITNVIFIMKGSAEVQPWNDIQPAVEDETVTWKSDKDEKEKPQSEQIV
ncbi:putative inorganic phosphate cotransporter [Lycorma delicatula]|uniref:putative inorganic phosphate cotransporter n=1 Tax=Lycorma delicatula TaxID=130591 RepID=UPI003F5114D0